MLCVASCLSVTLGLLTNLSPTTKLTWVISIQRVARETGTMCSFKHSLGIGSLLLQWCAGCLSLSLSLFLDASYTHSILHLYYPIMVVYIVSQPK